MRALTALQIRASFVNLRPAEAARIPLPGLHEVIWEEREYLGWRDPSLANRGYLVHDDDDGGAVGLVLRFAEGGLRGGIPAMCSMCRATQPATQVALASAPRASLDGASVGTYICERLDCSHIIRMLPPTSPWAPAPGDLLESRSAGLLARVRSFAANVRG
ncbi:MAG TPA: FBP domain-containing protein [Microbacteriaceae bacterium]|nr:FBP domain-containing protein [Microbacteriaceae bacterium]